MHLRRKIILQLYYTMVRSSETEGARKRLAAAKTQLSFASQNIKNTLAQQKIMMESLKASLDAAVKEVEEAQTALTNAEKKWEVIDVDQETICGLPIEELNKTLDYLSTVSFTNRC